MAFDYINEAFKKLDLLDEQMFDTSLNGINELSSFMDNDNTDDVVRVIDSDAKDAEGIKDSYVGKVIINCNVCHSHVFENKEDIKIEEDGTVNVEKQCPYCGEQEGFTIIGEIAPFGDAKEDEEPVESEEPVKDSDEGASDTEPLDEALGLGAGVALAGGAIGAGMVGSKLLDSYDENRDNNVSVKASRATRRVASSMTEASKNEDFNESLNSLDEDFKEVSIKTEDQKLEMTSDENGKVTVTTEPVTSETSGEAIVPVTAETEAEILDNNSEVVDEPTEESEETTSDISETEGEAEEEVNFDFDELDEEGMDELGESYLRKVYENVESFKTTSVAANENKLVVEGVIKFTSGAKKNTGFIFEAKDVNARGQLRFVGRNKHLAESHEAFSLVGKIDNKKLFVESLKYNYKVNEDVVRGIVRRK